MDRIALKTTEDVDLILWLVEPSTFIGAGEREIISQLRDSGKPVILVINKTDTVIEIGPGLGFLTESLAEKAGQVYAFEIDDDLVKILSEKFSKVENLKIIHTDFMDYDLSEIVEKEKNIKVLFYQE